jgi:hypothetical protein
MLGSHDQWLFNNKYIVGLDTYKSTDGTKS